MAYRSAPDRRHRSQLGGFVAACAAQRHRDLTAVGLLAPWDISYDARQFSKLSQREARARAPSIFNDVDGRLTGADAQSLMQAIRQGGRSLSLAAAARALSGRLVLLAIASRDDPDDQATELRATLAKIPTARLTFRRFETDHGFDDQRIALEAYVLNWLASLPVGPARS